ncbi:M56 family metallopeptidase [Flavilitoribacter nigricans]|uniref:Peptidase M56 domain-containing protein n=1 Tax=Flavilitoribacter nigricans (strain ATCC 23147 / DSM 23189 / NBRC 102662 / NCIMB 1420 / SS-2) TaxID=1122177 RepID=A0A2D0MZI1_FLAN2|nr:M56 family metallopeptidase [Flavilitoribacter nigricans]PHN01681.1 hypothetical protein CRP01_35625 [Flavilitoribacter nigricans DSM 23189 = NBRC 102662]
MFNQILPDALVQAGGWTILHSLWQGAIITLLLAFMLGKTRQHSPALRYQMSVGALLLLLGSVICTFYIYYEPASASNVIADGKGAGPGTFFLNESAPQLPAESGYLGKLFPILLQVWLVGVALMAIRMLGELAYLQRLRSVNTQPVSNSWSEKLNSLKWQMGILQPVEMRESLRVSGPMLVGWFKPVILLPVGMLSGLSPQQVECVLAHELAHVRRMDYLVNLIQSAVEVLLFFNPAVWWISAQIREEREHCCDELAVNITGDRLTLVKTLAQLEEWRMQGGQLGLAFNGRPQGILGRVQRLLGGESSVRIIGKGLWSLLFFCMATGLLAFRNSEEVTEPGNYWENIGIENLDPVERLDVRQTLPKIADVQQKPTKKVEPATAAVLAQATNPVSNIVAALPGAAQLKKLETAALRALPTQTLALLRSFRDTIPDEKYREQMRKLQLEMEKLQQEMMSSQEMQRIQELTKKYEVEMQAMQEKLMKEQGGYEKLMQEQQKVMQEVEKRHQELMQSEGFQKMQAEMERMSGDFSRMAEEMQRKFENNPEMLEHKMDSLSNIFDEKHEAFEKQYEAAFEALEKEMEAYENSPERKALEEQMDAMSEEMEKLMEARFEPMEVEMEKLQESLEKRFEEQMEALEEQMEKLEKSRHNRQNRKEE